MAKQLKIAETNPLRYRGYYYDNETGYYYLQSRYYDPDLGRFISADDFSYINPNAPLNINAYAYCANNPLIYSDPKGTAYVSEVGQAVAEIISSLFLCWDALVAAGEDFAYLVAGGIILDHENIFKNPKLWYSFQLDDFNIFKRSSVYKSIKLLDKDIFKNFYYNVVEKAEDTFTEVINGITITVKYIANPIKEAFDDMLNILYNELLTSLFIELKSKLDFSILIGAFHTLEIELYNTAITIRDKFKSSNLLIFYEKTEYFLNSEYISQTSAIYLEVFIAFMIAVCAAAGAVFRGLGGLTI